MSKATEEFKNLMESDRGERAYYEKADVYDNIRVPITRDGFEALVARACAFVEIPVTGPMRNVAVGFLHHLETTVFETSIHALSAALFKSLSNHMTYSIDQEIKAEANKELAEEREKARMAQEEIVKQQKIAAAQEKRSTKADKKNAGKLSKVTTGSGAPSDEKRQ